MSQAALELTFINAINNAEATASVPADTTREQILQTLIANNFIQPPQNGHSYEVSIKGRRKMAEGENLQEAGAQNLDRVLLTITMVNGAVHPQVRRTALLNNLNLLEKVRESGCPSIAWRARGSATAPDGFDLTYRLRSYRQTSEGPQFHTVWQCQVDIPANYPEPLCFQFEHVRFTPPIPYNPHVFADGRVCLGRFVSHETLWSLFRRMGQLLQLKPEVINLNDVANGAARDDLKRGLLQWSCDNSEFPDEQGAWAMRGSFVLNLK